MGTVKYSGPVASFHCPTEATIRSLKVHFSPKQLGEGTPSPENIRPIEGWDGVTVHNDKDGIIIPEDYQKVEYLESDGGQYFWTDINVQEGLTVKSVQSFLGTQDNYLFGGTVDSANNRSCFNGMYNRHVQGAYPNSYYNTNHSLSLNTVYHIETTHKDGIVTVDVDGVSTWTQSRGDTIVESGRKCICFGASNGAGDVLAKYLYRGRVYSLTVKKGEDGLANYIPCRRKSDNKPGMYDTVSGEFFTNQGTGEFICGPDVGETVKYEFGVLGKNKFPSADGTKSDVFMAKGITYTISATSSSSGYFKGYYKDGTDTGIVWVNEGSDGDRRWKRYTPREDIVSGFFYVTQGMSECQLELGSTATAYEPYNPNKTVYGGWVDLISGEVCETHYGEALSECNSEALSNQYNTAQTTFFRCQHTYEHERGGTYGVKDLMCETLKSVGNNWGSGDAQDEKVNTITERYSSYIAVCMRMYNSDLGIDAEDDHIVRKTKINTYLAQHPLFICYKLRTPNTYHLPPYSTTLKTFLAKNNVWSNADYVEVEYDLHETQSILARKQFIIANQPHVVKPAAAPLQNFVTDMAAPLKECKVHFSPVQEGEGDPSPENVRAISGWTGIDVYRTGKNMLDTATSDEILENWTLINPSYQKKIEKLPTDLSFTLQANIIKDLEKNISNCRLYLYGISISGKFINTATPLGIRTITNKPNAYGRLTIAHNYIGLQPDHYGATFNNMQLELGTIATAYEPYSGTTLPIDWTTEAGTIYGGYVDLMTGEVWAEWKYIDFVTANWTQFSVGTSIITVSLFPGTISSRNNGFCNILPMVSNPNISGIEGVDWNNNRLNLCLSVSREITTLADFKAWLQALKDGGITPCVVAKYGEPTLVTTLTPTQLKTLRGTNNIWASNGGDNIEIAYWKH